MPAVDYADIVDISISSSDSFLEIVNLSLSSAPSGMREQPAEGELMMKKKVQDR